MADASEASALLTFEQFRSLFLDDLKSKKPDFDISQDDHNVVLVAPDGTSGVMSIDILYRFFVDTAIQRPSASLEDLLTGCYHLIDNWRRNTDRQPLLKPSARPASLEGIVMMQKCISPA